MPRCFSGLLAKPFEAKSSLAVEVIGFGLVKELLEVLISPGLASEAEKKSSCQLILQISTLGFPGASLHSMYWFSGFEYFVKSEF